MKMIWPYSNQNILSKDDTMEPTRYLWAKRQPVSQVFKVGFKGQSHMFGLSIFSTKK